MCSSSSSALFYGVGIPTAPLAFAARAHPSIHGPLTIIQLVVHKFRLGTPQVKPSKEDDTKRVPADARVPVEVWERIKAYLLDEIPVEERRYIDKLLCKECSAEGEKKAREEASAEDVEMEGSTEAQPRHKRTTWTAPDCKMCLQNMLWEVGFSPFSGDYEVRQLSAIRRSLFLLP